MTDKLDIVFFDMDHTLIDNDCDVSWKEFLVEKGLAPKDERDEAQKHWEAYCRGELDEDKFLAFQLRQFQGKSPEEMRDLTRLHFEERVRPNMYPQAMGAIQQARREGKRCVMLSATNRPICEPVAEAFELDGLICTDLEMEDGKFTGRIVEPYCCHEGKIFHSSRYCNKIGTTLDRVAYYGDSRNDIPLLKLVAVPVVVNPEGELLELARKENWRIERWSVNGTESQG
ncbi:MAG: HAD family hydrolase [Candidatus Sumerlaeia bacterium]